MILQDELETYLQQICKKKKKKKKKKFFYTNENVYGVQGPNSS